MNKMRLMVCCLIVLLITMIISTSSLAHTISIETGVYDSTSKFKINSNGYHLGSTSTVFYYASAQIKSDYSYVLGVGTSRWDGKDIGFIVKNIKIEYINSVNQSAQYVSIETLAPIDQIIGFIKLYSNYEFIKIN